MSQFTVYRNRNPRTRVVYPLLVDVQAELLQDLKTRAVIPLTKALSLSEFPLTYLTPILTFERQSYVLMTPQLAAVALTHLGTPAGSVADQERAISTALDFLFRGF